MRADAVDRRDGALDAEQRVDPPLVLDLLGAALGQLVQGRQLDEIRHPLRLPAPGRRRVLSDSDRA